MKNTFDNFDARDTLVNKKVVTCVYSNYHFVYTPPITLGSTTGTMNREHTWPQSWGATVSPAQSDKHHIFPVEAATNSSRGNKPFGFTTTSTNYNIIRSQHRGDAARAMYYMSVRYHDVIGGYSWLLPSYGQDLGVLLEWHKQDPPDKWEMERNNFIQGTQQNRNPFVDNPEWVKFIDFNNLTKLSPLFAAQPQNNPSDFFASSTGNSITLTWTDAVAGSQAPTGYLLLAYNWDQYMIPIDGEVYPDDNDLSDGTARVNIAYDASNTYSFNGLSQDVNYYFTLIPYNGDGSQRNYRTIHPLMRTNITTSMSASTAVSFVSASTSVLENIGIYNLPVSISNPSASTPTTCSVVLTSGAASDIGNYTTQTVTFPAASAAQQSVTITITVDSTQTGDKVFVFQLQNISGGNSAVSGAHGSFALTVQDAQSVTSDVIINEFSQGSASAKEWVEILVVSDEYSLKNVRLTDNTPTLGLNLEFTGDGFTELSKGTIIVLYNGGDIDGMIAPDLTYDGVADKNLVISSLNATGNYSLNRITGWSSTTGAFGNASTSDNPRLVNASGDLIFEVPRFPSPASGRATRFNGNSTAKATDANYWSADIVSTATTPGLPNGGDNSLWIDIVLPVELHGISATMLKNGTRLMWATASELNNYGFAIERKRGEESWEEIGFVQGRGTSNQTHHYEFVDTELIYGAFSYRLRQMDLDGTLSFSEVVKVFRQPEGENVFFPANNPNPFNPNTQLQFSVHTKETIRLYITDIRGVEIVRLFNEVADPGKVYSIRFDGSSLPTGIYFARLSGATWNRVNKMLLVK